MRTTVESRFIFGNQSSKPVTVSAACYDTKNQLGSHETLADKSAAQMNVLAISLRFFAFISVWSFGMRSSLACSTMAAKALLVPFGKVDKNFVGFGRARRIDRDMVKGSRDQNQNIMES